MNESRIRLLHQFKSSIFSNDTPSKSLNSSLSKSRYGQSNSTLKTRIQDQSYSELFGSTTYRVSHRNKRDSDSASTPRLGKKLNFTNIKETLPKPCDAKVEVLQISGLKPYDNENILKEIAKKHHVVEVNTEFDNVKGICTGKGKISIRSFANKPEKDDLVLKLKNKGYDVNEEKVNNNKKNCMEWLPFKDLTLRFEKISERPNVSKENFEKINTPRYMKSTTSFANKYFR